MVRVRIEVKFELSEYFLSSVWIAGRRFMGERMFLFDINHTPYFPYKSAYNVYYIGFDPLFTF